MSRVDAFLFEWLELRETLQEASGGKLFTGKGMVYDAECPGCGAPEASHRTVATEKKKQKDQVGDDREVTRPVCARCKREWPGDWAFQPLMRWKNKPERHTNGTEVQLVRLVTLENLLSRLDLRAQRLYLRLFLFEDLRNYTALAEEANRLWPRMRPQQGQTNRAPARWSEWTARQVVLKSRDKLFHLASTDHGLGIRV